MKRKGYLLATAGSVAAAAGGAHAADLPMKAARYAPPAPPPVASWTGFYVGVNVGANWQMSSAAYGAGGFPGSGLPAGNAVGFIGGGQIGYNWQISPAIVLGVEASLDGLSGKATAAPEFNTTKGNGFQSEISWMATVRGRAGWLMSPDTLIYGTAGGAWAHIKESANPNGFASSTAGSGFTTKSLSKTKSGWVAGGGMEHMLNQNWTLGVEVLYADFGTSTGVTPAGTKTTTFKNQVVSGTLKLNYKF